MKTIKNKFLLLVFFMGTIALPALNAFTTQHSNAFTLFAYLTDDREAWAAAIVVDTLVGIGAATIFCGVQAAVAIGIAG